MRGVVTLAAAFIIPEETEHREVLLLIAFTVVAGTLFIQGLSLPWVARRLRVPSPDPLEDALARAALLQQASKAGFIALDELEHDDPHGVYDLIRQRVDQRNFAAWEQLSTTPGPGVAERPLRPRPAGDDRRGAAEGAQDPQHRHRPQRRRPRGAEHPRRRGVDARHRHPGPRRRRSARRAPCATGRSCDHLDTAGPAAAFTAEDGLVCEQCVELGTHWVSLRRCLACGNVACCDSSPHKHATEHFHDSTHAVMQSAQPGEDWRWCFVHHLTG